MDQITLAAYSALTIAALLLFILALCILANCIHKKSFNGKFKFSIGLALWSGFQFIDRAWWSMWKSAHNSHEASLWMVGHPITFAAPVCMTAGILTVILYLTQDSPYGRYFWTALFAVFGSGLLVMLR